MNLIFEKIFWRCIRSISPRLLPLFAKPYANFLYKISFNTNIDWENPKDLNQWINKLQIESDANEWGFYADKHRVREYIKACGLEDILVHEYGAWEKVEDIDFSKLPNSFVLKTNHGCADVQIVRNKESFLETALGGGKLLEYRRLLKHSYGLTSGEFHYRKIRPLIIAESLLNSEDQSFPSTSLIDYKLWCINGHFEFCMVLFDRTPETVKASLYDREWNNMKGLCSVKDHLEAVESLSMPKPKNWNRMISIAEKLSKNFKEARIDLYEVGGRVYFGEITLTSAAGRMKYFTQEFLEELGNKINH